MRIRLLAPTALTAAALALGLLQPPAGATTPRLVLAEQLSDLRVRDLRNLSKSSAILVSDPATGTVLYSRNADLPLLSASTMKLVTAVVALETLSPSHRIKTRVMWDEEAGALTLIGAGDPTLSRSGLARLAAKVRQALPKVKRAQLFVDGSLFPDPKPAAGWVKGYVPGQVNPVSSLPLLAVRTTTPMRTAGELFAKALRAEGITAYYKGSRVASGVQAAVRSSLPLQDIVKRMLVESDNDFAEHLFRLSAAAEGGEATWSAAQLHAYSQLEALGISTEGVVLADGSGLSRKNRLTVRLLAQLLNVTRSPAHPKLNRLLDQHLLPVAGQPGTLRYRFASAKTRCASGKVEAKTGTLHDTISLAGFVHTDEGVASFAVLVNGTNRSAQSSVRRDIDWVLSPLARGC